MEVKGRRVGEGGKGKGVGEGRDIGKRMGGGEGEWGSPIHYFRRKSCTAMP